MQRVIETELKPIKLWLDDIDKDALLQARNLANLPYTFKWVAIMADSHCGYGMPIGGVLATTDVIIPNAVGVDIGCGMCAVKTDIHSLDRNSLLKITEAVGAEIPLGHRHYKEKQKWEGFDRAPEVPVVLQELDNSRYQLGTLGGGNHFIEIQKDSDGYIWLMIHSGSRNFGLKIAREYHRIAGEYCLSHKVKLPHSDLACLPLDSLDGRNYIDAMNYALDFARANRFAMIESVKKILLRTVGTINFEKTINIHHNYAAPENHYGRNVMVHRKGATSANKGELGIIPGSQGTGSYIVKGKGNPESFRSCSHGAGRLMGRKQARRELNLTIEREKLDNPGIIHSIKTEKDLDEAPGAYKNIETVMENQKDLVDIVVRLSPLAVIKG